MQWTDMEELRRRFERSAAMHQERSEMHAEIGEIIRPWEDAILAAIDRGLRVKRVRMSHEAWRRLQDVHDRLTAHKGEPPYDVTTLYGLPIRRTA